MVLVGGSESSGGQFKSEREMPNLFHLNAARGLVTHAGDTVIVEEHTAVVDSRLEAVALGSAARGGEFQARLKIGGAVIRAIALDAGRASLVGSKEASR
jgi:hypothetical protein